MYSSNPPYGAGRGAPAPRHRGSTRIERATKTRRAVVSGLAGAAALTSMVFTQASATELSELDASWVNQPASVGTNDLVQGIAHVNLNDTLGEQGSRDNFIATLAFTNGRVPTLPSACKTEGVTPVSSISADKSTVTCNLGTVRYGTAVAIDFTVRAVGDAGQKLSGTVTTDGTTPVDLPPILITADAGVDVVFDASQTIFGNGGMFDAYAPFALSVPVGDERLAGPISFDLTAANDTTDNITSVLAIGNPDCVPMQWTVGDAPSTMPATGTGSPLPTTCTVTKTAAGKFHVVLDGYRDDLQDTPTKAADGSKLRSDRLFFAAGSFKIRSTSPVTPMPSGWHFTASNVKATTVSGVAAPEVDKTNNVESYTLTPTGLSSAWNRSADSGLPGDGNAIAGEGTPWDASPTAVPGEHIVAEDRARIWGGERVADLSASDKWGQCFVLDGAADFDGTVAPYGFDGDGNNTDFFDYYAGSSIHWAVYTGGVGASGNRDTFDCGGSGWDAVSATQTGTLGTGGIREYKLNYANPGNITALRLMVDATEVQAGRTTTPSGIGFFAGVDISNSAAAGTEIWELGSHLTRNGTWRTAADLDGDPITTVSGSQYPSTNPLRDVVRIIPGNLYNHKSVSDDTVVYGQRVTYTLTSGVGINTGTTKAISWTETDVLPAGMEYVDGSASPAPSSVTANSDGTTTLKWDLTGPYNTDKVITYDAIAKFLSGKRTNTASVDGSAFGTYKPTTNNGGIDTATVTVSTDGQTFLTKESLAPTFAAGATNTWRLGLQNLDTVDQSQTDIIDVLPWNGDPRGSQFHGDYAITDVTLNPGETVWYTTADPATINHDPADPSNGAFGAPGGIWSTTKPADAYSITGVRIVGGVLPVGATKYNNILWDTKGAQADDNYENIAWAKATHTRLQMIKAAAATTVLDGSKLQIDKEYLSHTGWTPGEKVTYTVDVKNPSDKTAYDVVVKDLGGNGLDGSTATFSDLSQGSIDADGIWQVGTLAAGEVVHAKVTVTIAAGYKLDSALTNVIYVENPSNPFNPTTGVPVCQETTQIDPATGKEIGNVDADTDQCDKEVLAPPALHIDKKASDANRNGVITWTLNVRADGDLPVKDVKVVDQYPAGLDVDTVKVVSAPTQGTFDTATGEWTIGDLTPGTVATMKFAGQVAKADLRQGVVNTAVVSSPEIPQPPLSGPDGACGMNEAATVSDSLDADDDQCDVTYSGATDLKVHKETVGVTKVNATTGRVTWLVEAGNFGGHDARNTIVTDTLPAGYIAGTLTVTKKPSKGTFDTKTAVWNLGLMTPGEKATVTVAANFPLSVLEKTVVNRVIIDSPDSPYCTPAPAAGSTVKPTDTMGAAQPADSCLPPCLTSADMANGSSAPGTMTGTPAEAGGSCLPPCADTSTTGTVNPGTVTGATMPADVMCVPPCQVINDDGSVVGFVNDTMGTTSGLCVPPCAGDATTAAGGGVCLPPCAFSGTGDNGPGMSGETACFPPCQNNDTLAGDTDQCDIAPAVWKPEPSPTAPPKEPFVDSGVPVIGGASLGELIAGGVLLISAVAAAGGYAISRRRNGFAKHLG